MTYRERREARAERLREWAEKREHTANAQLNSQPSLRHDWAFITQPGHIPERARMNAADGRAVESLRKAEGMVARADGIEGQLAHAIYSDDDDAVTRLKERIVGLEAERDRIKAYNKSCRDGKPNLPLLTKEEQRVLLSCLQFQAYACKQNQFPAYHLANLNGNLNRQKHRLANLEPVAVG